MSQNPYSVTDIVGLIKHNLESEFHNIIVRGEVTNLSRASSGHYYFNIKDENSNLSIVLFRGDGMRNPLIRKLKDGDLILCQGSIGVYEKRGSFQLIAKRIFPDGKKGSAHEEFLKLKAKLTKEGIFDLDKKTPIPPIPAKIAVITAIHGAALQDFLNVYRRYATYTNILIIPTQMQGESAPSEIIQGLNRAIHAKCDLIVLTRGGGSSEDLNAFNNEALVRAIHKTKVPLISAVGHHVDTTLCDYVADMRCETPTAAAESISRIQLEYQTKLKTYQKFLKSNFQLHLGDLSLALLRRSPKALLDSLWKNYMQTKERLDQMQFLNKGEKVLGIDQIRMELDDSYNELIRGVEEQIQSYKYSQARNLGLLDALNPKMVLKRGYSIIKKGSHVVSSSQEMKKIDQKQKLEFCFHDGSFHGHIKSEN